MDGVEDNETLTSNGSSMRYSDQFNAYWRDIAKVAFDIEDSITSAFLDKLEKDTLIDEAAKFRTQELVNVINPALRDVHSWHEFEDYNIFFFGNIFEFVNH